ncbi:hypothetical protein V5O48_016368 [Marasmius crinis-equi]|uniref:Uncharacterized protein n=1 Tax=Marasmius crinis-equi TaxID=585013 RepID=A0ABR3ERY0_9AGAR
MTPELQTPETQTSAAVCLQYSLDPRPSLLLIHRTRTVPDRKLMRFIATSSIAKYSGYPPFFNEWFNKLDPKKRSVLVRELLRHDNKNSSCGTERESEPGVFDWDIRVNIINTDVDTFFVPQFLTWYSRLTPDERDVSRHFSSEIRW